MMRCMREYGRSEDGLALARGAVDADGVDGATTREADASTPLGAGSGEAPVRPPGEQLLGCIRGVRGTKSTQLAKQAAQPVATVQLATRVAGVRARVIRSDLQNAWQGRGYTAHFIMRRALARVQAA
ncbi:hypothetical protein EON67_05745 [archaeon]|nr:MAG: hypothetical protein EON67_05745 [archaeon]